MYIKWTSLLVATAIATSVSPALARLGVGVATGKIEIKETLHPGSVYRLPPFTVVNTGDEPSDYTVGISQLQGQRELSPNPAWFSYSPATFSLDPGATRAVTVTLAIPVRGVTPGTYFAYLSAHPATKVQGGSSVGIAAAAKLYFSVAPANIFASLYYRIRSLWQDYLPWSNVVAAVMVGSLILVYLRHTFSFTIRKKQEKNE